MRVIDDGEQIAELAGVDRDEFGPINMYGRSWLMSAEKLVYSVSSPDEAAKVAAWVADLLRMKVAKAASVAICDRWVRVRIEPKTGQPVYFEKRIGGL